MIENSAQKVDTDKLRAIIKELAGYLEISPEYIAFQNTPSGGF